MECVVKMSKTLERKKISLWIAVTIVTLFTVVLGFTDLMISSEISFSIFYLIPVTLAVFLHGRTLGFVFSVICALVWIAADIASGLRYDAWYIPVWNTLVRFGYFIFHSMLLSQLLHTIEVVNDSALKDPLTKLSNWRHFEQYSSQLLRQASGQPTKMTVAYIDLDNFKQVNDALGHGAGDQVLVTVSQVLQQQLRSQDMVARLGGDEFAVILVHVDLPKAKEILQRIQVAVQQEMKNHGWPVTLSIGAMVFSIAPPSINPMLKMVDDLMYEVKKNGKNNLKIIEQSVASI